MTRNFLAALYSLRVQQFLLVVLRLHGPLTSQEILTIAGQRTPLGKHSLSRLLVKLQAVHLVKHWRMGRNFHLWTLAKAPIPTRTRVTLSMPSARPSAHGSWWASAPRASWQQTLEQRWSA